MTYRPKLASRRKIPASLLLGAAQHLGPYAGVAQPGDAFGHGQGEDLAPAGDEVERAEGAERHVHGGEDRHRERDDPATGLARALTGDELARYAFGYGGVDGEDVPVERPPGGGAHLDEQVDLLVRELVEAPGDDGFELGALVLADRPAEREQFGGPGVPGGDGFAVTVRVGGGLGGGEPPGAGVHGVVEQGEHGVELCGGGLPADRVRAHDVAPQARSARP